MSYGFKERTDSWNEAKKIAAGMTIQPSDAGSKRTCDSCGWEYEDEKLIIDENGWIMCPTCEFAPEPDPIEIPEYDYYFGE